MLRLSKRMHPLVYVGTMVALVAFASRELWAGDRTAFFDRIMLALAGGVLLWTLSKGTGSRRVEEAFRATECAEEAPAPEDTSEIDGLKAKLYASVFGPSPVANGNWGGRLRINQERTSNTTDQTSADIASQGLNIFNRSLHGPPADELGLATTDKFTWVIAARFNSFDDFATTDVTSDTLAQMETSTAGPDYVFKLDLTPGSRVDGTTGTRVQFDMAAGSANSSSPSDASPVFDPEQPYMIVVNRNAKLVQVRRYPLMTTATTGQLGGAEQILSASDVTQGLAASNQKVLFNVAGRFDMSAYAIALFENSLSETQEVQLQEYFERRIKEAMDPDARQPGDCPYGPDVCANHYCAGISDWSKPELVIDSRVECKQAIDEFCKANHSHPSCYCWNNDDTRFESEDCLRWRAFIGAGECKAIDSLTDADLDRVKELYKLQEVQCVGDKAKEKPKTGIINHYDENESESEPPDNGGGKEEKTGKGEAKPGISNFYKVPGLEDGDTKPVAKSAAAVDNPYAGGPGVVGSGGGRAVSNPYDGPHHGRPSVSEADKNRLVPMHNLQFHDKWGDRHNSRSLSPEEPVDKPKKGIWHAVRSFISGDD